MSHTSESFCAGCGVQRIGPGIEGAPGDVLPCPNCGDIGLNRQVTVADTMRLRERAKVRNRGPHDGATKDLRTTDLWAEFYRKDGRWHEVRRLFDHVNDWYDEVITDEETGAIVHECHEPLSQHKGHGNARRGPQRSEDTRRQAAEGGP